MRISIEKGFSFLFMWFVLDQTTSLIVSLLARFSWLISLLHLGDLCHCLPLCFTQFRPPYRPPAHRAKFYQTYLPPCPTSPSSSTCKPYFVFLPQLVPCLCFLSLWVVMALTWQLGSSSLPISNWPPNPRGFHLISDGTVFYPHYYSHLSGSHLGCCNGFLTGSSSQNNGPLKIFILVSRICEYVRFCDERKWRVLINWT